MLRYLEPGNMVFQVYLKHLDELGIDIRYGDYVELRHGHWRFATDRELEAYKNGKRYADQVSKSVDSFSII